MRTLLSLLLVLASVPSLAMTKAELLYGHGYERPDPGGHILTLAHARGFASDGAFQGDLFAFADVLAPGSGGMDGFHDGIHAEATLRWSLLRSLGDGQRDGLLKDVYLVAQLDHDRNPVVTKTTRMAGVSADWSVPHFRFLKTHVQRRDDPKLDGQTWQLNLIWSAGFNLGNQAFSFDGVLDWTAPEGRAHGHVISQPQLLWHPTKNAAIGVEYQFWRNRLGIKGFDEHAGQLLVRWTF